MSDFWERLRAFFRRINQGIRNLLYRLFAAIAGEERVDGWISSYRRSRENFRSFVHQYIDPDSRFYPFLRGAAKVFLNGLLLLAIYVFMLETNFLWLTGEIPSVEDLRNPKLNQASEIYSLDGVEIGKFFTENRTPIAFKDIPKHVKDALIATEDIRFYNHSGIDTRALGAVAVSVITGGDRGGGSTITQQLAKNLFKTRRTSKGLLGRIPFVRTVVVKSKEWLMAKKLESNFTKEEILTYYFNTVDFGSNSFGLKTAARTYFNKTPDSLNVQEGAVLVGLQKATTTYNPLRHPKRSTERRNVVLSQMAKYGYLTKSQADSISRLPLVTNYTPENPSSGPASYLKNAVADFMQEWGERKGYDLYTSGLKIYTTIDSRMQKYADDAVNEKMKQLQQTFNNHWSGRNPWTDEKGKEIPGFIDTVAKRTERYRGLIRRFPDQPDSVQYYMKVKKNKIKVFDWNNGEREVEMTPYDSIAYYKRFLQAGMVAMDPRTGYIRAWVGGIDHTYFKYDHVKQAKRQPGSTFKPFVYTAAIDDTTLNLSPCDRIRDEPFRVEVEEKGEKKYWEPKNSTGYYSYANLTLRRALARSINSITARLTDRVGPSKVADYAHRLGIKSRLAAVPSIGLGSSDVSLYEMVAAYCTFVNEGKYTEPLIIQRIEDRNGNEIEVFQSESKQVINPETAFLMVHMLRGGLEESGGTSQNLWSFNIFRNGHQMGGKTGTTSNNSDGWFIGVSNKLVIGAWVGGDDRSIHFRSTDLGEGAKTAMPLVGRFLEKVYADAKFKELQGPFPKPAIPIIKEYLDCGGGYEEEPVEEDTLEVEDEFDEPTFEPTVPTAPEPVPDTTGNEGQ
ncbi:transglycosylase domain-containing protein [Nibrella saemangeumensis]|uniref:Transglycosylase domain-containing protein n=1 Tax=Nibrella saemangeumensis TaxID=1084526 RepID=A0ABP8MRK2_9BACT